MPQSFFHFFFSTSSASLAFITPTGSSILRYPIRDPVYLEITCGMYVHEQWFLSFGNYLHVLREICIWFNSVYLTGRSWYRTGIQHKPTTISSDAPRKKVTWDFLIELLWASSIKMSENWIIAFFVASSNCLSFVRASKMPHFICMWLCCCCCADIHEPAFVVWLVIHCCDDAP